MNDLPARRVTLSSPVRLEGTRRRDFLVLAEVEAGLGVRGPLNNAGASCCADVVILRRDTRSAPDVFVPPSRRLISRRDPRLGRVELAVAERAAGELSGLRLSWRLEPRPLAGGGDNATMTRMKLRLRIG